MLFVLEQPFASESSLHLSLPLSLCLSCLCFYDSFIVVLLFYFFSAAFSALRSALSLDGKEVEALPEAVPA